MANRTYYRFGKRIARSQAVDEDGVCYPGVYFHDPDREANAAARANGHPNARAYAAAIDHMLAVGRRKPPKGGQIL